MNPSLAEQIRHRYAWAAREVIQKEFSQLNVLGACCSDTPEGSCCSTAGAGHVHEGDAVPTAFGPSLYPEADTRHLPSLAVSASCGCGNPIPAAHIREGEVVLDLGSGSGVDVLLAARSAGASGKVYGLDMTDEVVALAESARRSAGLDQVEFLRGRMEQIPLPDAAVDVIISNCALNLSPDKHAVFAEMARVLHGGGRMSICDVLAADSLSVQERAARGSVVDCIAGALSFAELAQGLAAAGFQDIETEISHPVADQMFAARITARLVIG